MSHCCGMVSCKDTPKSFVLHLQHSHNTQQLKHTLWIVLPYLGAAPITSEKLAPWQSAGWVRGPSARLTACPPEPLPQVRQATHFAVRGSVWIKGVYWVNTVRWAWNVNGIFKLPTSGWALRSLTQLRITFLACSRSCSLNISGCLTSSISGQPSVCMGLFCTHKH